MGGRGSIGGVHVGAAPVRKVQTANNHIQHEPSSNNRKSKSKPNLGLGKVMTKKNFRERMLALMNKKG